jgi:hypothetical protein
MSDREMGMVLTELAVIYLKQHRPLEAADLLTAYGWMCFNLGQGSRLARQAQILKQRTDWKDIPENECGGLLLYYLLASYLGKAVDTGKRATDYQHMLALVDEGKVTLQQTILMDLTDGLSHGSSAF